MTIKNKHLGESFEVHIKEYLRDATFGELFVYLKEAMKHPHNEKGDYEYFGHVLQQIFDSKRFDKKKKKR
jgi:hypothetical protein